MRTYASSGISGSNQFLSHLTRIWTRFRGALTSNSNFEYIYWIQVFFFLLFELVMKVLGPILVVCATVLIVGIFVLFYKSLLPVIVGHDYTSWQFFFHGILGLFFATNILYNYYMCITTNPGDIHTPGKDPDYDRRFYPVDHYSTFQVEDDDEDLELEKERKERRERIERKERSGSGSEEETKTLINGSSSPMGASILPMQNTSHQTIQGGIQLTDLHTTSNEEEKERGKLRGFELERYSKQSSSQSQLISQGATISKYTPMATCRTKQRALVDVKAYGFCKKCRLPRPPRTHHCHICRKCVLAMDHHCPWMNNCVGYYNYRYFLLFLVFLFTAVVYGAIVLYRPFKVLIRGDPKELEQWFPSEYAPHSNPNSVTRTYDNGAKMVNDMNKQDKQNKRKGGRKRVRGLVLASLLNLDSILYDEKGAVFFCFFVAVVISFAVGILLFWHLYLVSTAQTTIDFYVNHDRKRRMAEVGIVYKNPYDLGFRKNWAMVMGKGKNIFESFCLFLPSSRLPPLLAKKIMDNLRNLYVVSVYEREDDVESGSRIGSSSSTSTSSNRSNSSSSSSSSGGKGVGIGVVTVGGGRSSMTRLNTTKKSHINM